MAIADKLLNTRAPQSVRDRLDLMARRRGKRPGTLHRDLLMEAMVLEEARDLYRTIGFEEIMRRLTKPTYPVHERKGIGESRAGIGQIESDEVVHA